MGVVLLQILQWILRIILFLLILLLVLGTIILIVPIRYRAEWDFLEKKPGVRGKITWFFYLIYMRFYYEEEFRMQVKVCGFKVFDSIGRKKKDENTPVTNPDNMESEVPKTNVESAESSKTKNDTENIENKASEKRDENIKITAEDELTAWEKEVEAEAKEEAELTKQMMAKTSKEFGHSDFQNGESKQNDSEQKSDNSEPMTAVKNKKSLSEKIDDIKAKIYDLIQKIKDIIAKIQEGKLKVEHYLELWNRKETQITFGRAKTKLCRMIKAVLPGKWMVMGEIGFSDPCTTGQLMGVLGAMYPIFGNKVQIVPDFENEVLNIEGILKGHIRLGNLLYQLISLLLNRHCFKFIKLVFDELGSSKKKSKNSEV